jgi:hypothetical protein
MNQQPALLKRGFEIFRHSPALFVGVAVTPYATLHAGLLALTWFFLRSKGGGEGADLRAAWAAMTTTDTLEFLALFLLQITVPYAVAGRGISRVASDQIAGREISFPEEVGDMLEFLPSAIVLAAIAAIAAFVGVAFSLIPGFVAGASFSLVLPAGVVEGIGPFAALRRGLSLVWRVAGRVLLIQCPRLRRHDPARDFPGCCSTHLFDARPNFRDLYLCPGCPARLALHLFHLALF